MERFNQLETLPERLQKAGYVTGMAGKWHLGINESDKIAAHGFDKVFLKRNNAPGHWNMDLDGKDIEPQMQKGGGYHLDLVSTFACTFIERFKDKPFFFYLAYRAPHAPLDAPQNYLDRFPGEMPERRRQALAMLSAVDDGVGRIVKMLKKHDLKKDTLIFVIGDNDAPLKIHKIDAPGNRPGWNGSLNDPMNGEKGMLTEGGIRTPFVVYWEGTIPGGQVYSHPVIALDVAATATALAGLPEDPALDGVNLVPYLTGEKKDAPHEMLYWRWLGQSAIRKGKWKYLRGDTREYLFDMENDIEEKNNLLQSHPEIAKELLADLKKWADTLSPPDIWDMKSEGMSRSANEYFNWYLDGKRDAPTPMSDAKGNRGEAKKTDQKKKGPPIASVFKRCDGNKDGIVTWEEFLNERTEKVPQIRKNFEGRDKNKDGKWTKDEIENQPASSDRETKARRPIELSRVAEEPSSRIGLYSSTIPPRVIMGTAHIPDLADVPLDDWKYVREHLDGMWLNAGRTGIPDVQKLAQSIESKRYFFIGAVKEAEFGFGERLYFEKRNRSRPVLFGWIHGKGDRASAERNRQKSLWKETLYHHAQRAF
jgi:uncharacterized sulfatase